MIGGDTNIVFSLSKAALHAYDHSKVTSLERKLHEGRAMTLKSLMNSYKILHDLGMTVYP